MHVWAPPGPDRRRVFQLIYCISHSLLSLHSVDHSRTLFSTIQSLSHRAVVSQFETQKILLASLLDRAHWSSTDCLVHSCSKILNILACPYGHLAASTLKLEVRDYPPGMCCSSNFNDATRRLSENSATFLAALLLDEPLAAINMQAPPQS